MNGMPVELLILILPSSLQHSFTLLPKSVLSLPPPLPVLDYKSEPRTNQLNFQTPSCRPQPLPFPLHGQLYKALDFVFMMEFQLKEWVRPIRPVLRTLTFLLPSYSVIVAMRKSSLVYAVPHSRRGHCIAETFQLAQGLQRETTPHRRVEHSLCQQSSS